MIGTLVRLKWTLTLSTLRKSTAQLVGYILGCVLGAAAVVSATVTGCFSGIDGLSGAFGLPAQDSVALARTVLPLFATLAILYAAIVQAAYLGESSTLGVRKFAIYGIPDRKLVADLFVAGLTGVPAVCAMLALTGWSLAYRSLGAAAVVAGIVSAFLFVAIAMMFSKMLLALATIAVRTERGKTLFYFLSFVLIFVAAELPNVLQPSLPSMLEAVGGAGSAISTTAGVLGWLPFGAPMMLPFAVASGDWLDVAGRLAVIIAGWLLCFAVNVLAIRHDRLHPVSGSSAPDRTARRHAAHGARLGLFGIVSNSPAGAETARVLAYLKRDARQAPMLIMPILFLVLFTFDGLQMGNLNDPDGAPVTLGNMDDAAMLPWMSLLFGGLMIALTECNGLSYDGTGYTMEAIAGMRGIDNRRGRLKAMLGPILVIFLVCGIATFLVTGDWRSTDGIVTGLTWFAVSVGLALAELGVALVMSTVVLVPVQPLDRPFSSPQGRALASAFMPLLAMLIAAVTMLPTGLFALVIAVTHHWMALYPWLIAIGPVNGVAMLVTGTVVGGRLLDRRQLHILATLRHFRSLQQ
ncbi:hypothetical protein [Bifidobacterium choloepi]|uniref:Uncharacterized protein n=1 Tax=Bifidobacterium choloepi TaxID=2614131 RepID=A0A6I5N1P5_9BIFI|nr:hypothetical protein [Bifidobacterium choloepi]NEG69549.1 hypothetical protein [Bifidobacterium choloepi]